MAKAFSLLCLAYNAKFERRLSFSQLCTSEGTICCPCFLKLYMRRRDKSNLPKVKDNIRKNTENKTSGLLIMRHLVSLPDTLKHCTLYWMHYYFHFILYNCFIRLELTRSNTKQWQI